jgi:TRAP-type mannitol/chloroaromatic compound transport system permease large subunit
LGPVAAKMGIDLIWFGVLICVNMQTSFMHPPFGFALFYLRGISDTLFKNGSIEKKVESRDIYLGAIPWVILQLLLVVVVIFFPQTVTAFLDKPIDVDLNSIQIEAPAEDNYGGNMDEEQKIKELNNSLSEEPKK